MTAERGQEIPGKQWSVRVQRGGPELVEQIAGEWRRLCDESGDEEVFYRPEWAQAYLQAFEPKAEVVMISAWAGERLRGILPLVRRRAFVSGFPIATLTIPANVHSLRASLTVCPGEEGTAVLKALWQAAKNLPQLGPDRRSERCGRQRTGSPRSTGAGRWISHGAQAYFTNFISADRYFSRSFHSREVRSAAAVAGRHAAQVSFAPPAGQASTGRAGNAGVEALQRG